MMQVVVPAALWDEVVCIAVPGIKPLRAKLIGPPGTALLRAHWGLYAHPGVRRAVMYNDDIRIWALRNRLDDLVAEPLPGR